MDWIKIVGYIAAASTTIKTKDTKAISLGMYVLFTFGVLMWLIYGIFNTDWPIIVANGVTLILAIVILFYKMKYK
jgi:MtN3 and saliva related transmembrane protein